jgi:AcrR family transcriptional regulator
MSTVDTNCGTGDGVRADAARNRERILRVAYETFAAEGYTVPIDEIARRVGVGPGTLYRHFPTKEALFRAIAADRITGLVDHARSLAADPTDDPGQVLFAFLERTVETGATDRALVEALGRSELDLDEIVPGSGQDFLEVLGLLLRRAQEAGRVRADVSVQDVKTLLVGCQAMQTYTNDTDLTRRLMHVVRDGLTATPAADRAP